MMYRSHKHIVLGIILLLLVSSISLWHHEKTELNEMEEYYQYKIDGEIREYYKVLGQISALFYRYEHISTPLEQKLFNKAMKQGLVSLDMVGDEILISVLNMNTINERATSESFYKEILRYVTTSSKEINSIYKLMKEGNIKAQEVKSVGELLKETKQAVNYFNYIASDLTEAEKEKFIETIRRKETLLLNIMDDIKITR